MSARQLHLILVEKCADCWFARFRLQATTHNGMITGAYNVYRCLGECVPEYAYYYFMHIDSFKGLKPFYTGLRKVVRSETFSNIKMPAPNCLEQQKIANFLDYETAKIDSLIEKQQQLIKLLKEKRQAVISHAVTKGLNPNAPMRHSGIEWMSEAPMHWEGPNKIKNISSLKGRLGWQGLKAEEYKDDGPYVVSSAHFENHKIQWEHCPHVSSERYELDSNIQLAEDDILLMKDGAAMGKLAFVDHLPDSSCLNSHLLLFRPIKIGAEDGYIPRFMFYFMQTDYFQGYIKVNGTGATFLGVSQQTIGNYRIMLPPLAEQQKIVAFLDIETTTMDELEILQRQMTRLLQERRTALISAAVTGKIDVRSWQGPEPILNTKETNKEVAA